MINLKRFKSGLQSINTIDGYIIPMRINSGLAYIDMRSSTDDELDSFPHVVLISEIHLNPSVIDNDIFL